MELPDELILPSAAEDEKRASPLVRSSAELIGALGANAGFMPPKRLDLVQEVADSVGTILGEPSLVRVLMLRALSAPALPRTALAAVRAAASETGSPMRADLMREFGRLLADAKPAIAELGPDVAAALNVPMPESMKRGTSSMRDSGGSLVERAFRLVRSEDPLLAEARGFAVRKPATCSPSCKPCRRCWIPYPAKSPTWPACRPTRWKRNVKPPNWKPPRKR